MVQHPDGSHAEPHIGAAVPIPTRPGLFRSDVHGGTVYIANPVSYHVGPAYRVPLAGYGGSSAAVPDADLTLQQRTAAAQMGLFAVWQIPLLNYGGQPLPAQQALPVEGTRTSLSQIVPGHPLGLTSPFGHRGG